MNAVLPTFGRARSESNVFCTGPFRSPRVGSANVRTAFFVFNLPMGLPSCRKSMSISITLSPFQRTIQRPLAVKRPMTVASTSCRSNSCFRFSQFFLGTARVIRSCDSDIHICLAPAALLCHLRNRARDAARAIVGNARVETLVPRLTNESVREFFLGDRVAYLDSGRRASLRERLRGKRGSVNPVQSDTSAGDNHEVARTCFFFVQCAAPLLARDEPHRTGKDERLAAVTRVDCEKSKGRRYATLIAAVIDTLYHTFENAARRQ